MTGFLVIILTLLCVPTSSKPNTSMYYGDKVYRLSLESKKDVKRAVTFYKRSRDVLDYWAVDMHLGGYLDFRITPKQTKYLKFLGNMSLTVKIENIAELLQQGSKHRIRRDTEKYSYKRYNSAASTLRELYRLAGEYPNITNLVTVGASHEGRPLLVMEIAGTGRLDGNTPFAWVDGGVHAREWITVASSMYFIRQLLQGYGKDNYTTQLLSGTKFAVQVLANPDGYAFSWNSERLWRKNRAPTQVGWCKGIDLNRNFDVNFGGHGSSSYSCSEVYSGDKAFSENESHGIARYLSSARHKLLAYFSLHSYGQMWLTPLSYTKKKVNDRPLHLNVAAYATKSIKSKTGHRYDYGPATTLMYLTSGDSADWVYAKLNCSHAYGIELSDNGRHGFLLPESHITPVGKDVLTGVLAAVHYITTAESGPTDQNILTTRKRHRKTRKKDKNRHEVGQRWVKAG